MFFYFLYQYLAYTKCETKIITRLKSTVLLSLWGKYTCSGAVPAQPHWCISLGMDCMTWRGSPAPPPLFFSFFLSQAVSSLSLWERDRFAAAVWEINRFFFFFFTDTGGGAVSSLTHNDNMRAAQAGFILWNSLNKLLCPLFLLSVCEYSYDLCFWYLGWVFFSVNFPETLCMRSFCVKRM